MQMRKSGSDGRIIDITHHQAPITKHLDHDWRLQGDRPVASPRQELVHAVIPPDDPPLLRDDNPLSFTLEQGPRPPLAPAVPSTGTPQAEAHITAR